MKDYGMMSSCRRLIWCTEIHFCLMFINSQARGQTLIRNDILCAPYKPSTTRHHAVILHSTYIEVT